MRAARLASRVQARYARHESLVRAPEMSLVAVGVPVTLQPLHHHAQHLYWAPRLHFVLAGGAGRRAPARVTTAPGIVRRERLETVVRRMVSRAERVASLGARQSAPAEGVVYSRATVAPAGARADAVTRVFQKPARAFTPAQASPASPLPATTGLAETARWPGWPPARTAVIPAAVDVDRLTDQVVHAIGRRMSAHRERRGR